MEGIRYLLLTALILSSCGTQALAYYHPDEGRWLSRDPIGEKGGPNLYVFVQNDPVGRWDVLGLWTKIIRKKEQQWATTCNDKEPFTVDSLAKLLKLDKSQAFGQNGWLRLMDGGPILDNMVHEYWSYRVPNTLHITQGNLEPGPPLNVPVYADTQRRKEQLKAHYSKEKYYVEDHFAASIGGNALGEINGWLSNDPYVAIWAHFGHGEFRSGQLILGTGVNQAAYNGSAFRIHHRISTLVLYSCFARNQKSSWFLLLAKGGVLRSTRNYIAPSKFPWQYLSTDVKP